MTGPALGLELLYTVPAEPDVDALLERVRETLPSSVRADNESDSTQMIVHQDFGRVIADGSRIPLFTMIMPSTEPRVIEVDHDFTQTWGWREAERQVNSATSCIALIEVMGHLHEPSDRRKAFRAVVEALVATTDPVAMWAPNICKFVPPAHADGLEPFINVRLFRVEGSDGEVVMDSLGLHTFELPDVQCHFRGIDPGAMAPLLYNTAAYILDRGDVIEDGNTVAGPRGDERWRCQHEEAIIGPERLVLDIAPDAPFAAGSRSAPDAGKRSRWGRRG